MRLATRLAVVCLLALASTPLLSAPARSASSELPVYFEPNVGQTSSAIRFLSRGSGYTCFLTDSEAVFRLRSEKTGPVEVLRMQWVGSNTSPLRSEGRDALSGRSNYFVGASPSRWRTGVQHYGAVRFYSVYDGIDLQFYGSQEGEIEYDFLVAPGADPRAIRVRFDGARRLRLDNGDLIAVMKHGEVRQRKPIAYQMVDGRRVEVPSRFVIASRSTATVAVGDYDRQHELIIDPVIDYSTYLGGSLVDGAIGVGVDGAAHAYVIGHTESLDFPITEGAFQPVKRALTDGFIAKLSSDGSQLLYSTYFGGSNVDIAEDVSVDTGGHAYITGHTYSRDFPVTPGAFQPVHGGGVFDAFVMKVHPDGSQLEYSTFLGGSGNDRGSEIANDHANRAVVAGGTSSPNFPVTPNAVQPVNRGANDAFVASFDNDGATLLLSTYLGTTGDDAGTGVSVDPDGDIYIGGYSNAPGFPTTPNAFQPAHRARYDGFVSRLQRDGVLLYSTYLGGSLDDFVNSLEVSRQGEAHVTGQTNSLDYPVTPNAVQPVRRGGTDVLVTKLNPTGSALEFSTYLGGAAFDDGNGIDLDGPGNVYVMGRTLSPNFPVTPNAFQPAWRGGFDAIVVKLNRTGSELLLSSYLGGTLADADRGPDIAVESASTFVVAGNTASLDFPVTPGVFQPANRGTYDAFVTKIRHDPGNAAAVNVFAPAVARSIVQTQCVIATVTDALGNGVAGSEVRFHVTGTNNTSGAAVSDANAQARFCYGSTLVGLDLVTAHLDLDRDGTRDLDEPAHVAQVSWTLP